MKINTATRMKFDYSVSTEDRFALRNWFDKFVGTQHEDSLEKHAELLDEKLTVEGFTEGSLDKQGYLDFIKARHSGKRPVVIRYPEMHFSYKHFLFHLDGTFEGFVDGIIAYEGTLELKIMKHEDSYTLVWQKFYPRMMFKG